MDKKFHFASKLITALFILGFMLGSSSDPPNGRTGAPGDGVCSSCHSGNNFSGNVSLVGLPASVISGESYNLTISVNNTDGNAIRAGFQMVSLFDENTENSGEFATSTDDVGTSTADGRQYIEHRGAKNFQSKTAEWNFTWVAPLVSEPQAVTMFAAGNIANGSGSGGDAIKFGTFQTMIETTSSTLEGIVEIESEPSCEGASDGTAIVEATGGEAPYTYSWSTGGNMNIEMGIAAGNHSVTITDANGEEVIIDFEMAAPPALVISANPSPVFCHGGQDGSILTTITGGSAPYLYEWSNGATTTDLQNLSAGIYTLTITDDNGCTFVSEVEITEPDPIQVTINTTAETAMDANDGTAIIDITGGTAPYTFIWVGGEPDLDNMAPGEYEVSIVDDNGCSQVKVFNIISFECDFVVGFNSTDVSCFGANDGEASVDPEIFTQPLNIDWSTGESEFIFVLGLSPGSYNVTLTDGNGCIKIEEFQINEPAVLNVELEWSIADCATPEVNQLQAIVEGGTAPYSYTWSNGGDIPVLNNIAEGLYVVTVTDANDCMTVLMQDVVYTDTEAPSISVVDSVVVYLDETGTSMLTANDYDLGTTDNCELASVSFRNNVVTCDHLSEDEIVFLAEDSSGNIDSVNIPLIVIDTIAPTAVCVEDIVINTCDTIIYDLPDFMDNCSVDTFYLAEGFPSGSVFPIDTTKVTYFFYDQSGNFGCCSFNVIVTDDLTVTIDTATNATQESGGSIDISVTGGSGTYTYEWVMNDTLIISNLEDVNNLDPGIYVVSVYDSNGCFVNSEAILIEFSSATWDLKQVSTVQVFPNPSNDLINISSNEVIESIQILGINGKKVQHLITIGERESSIDISTLAPGVYFLSIKQAASNEVIKVVKQ